MDYKISTQDYLARARHQLDSGSKPGLFYAAFELRCGIESRIHRYLEARENITKLKRKGWRIAKMAAQIESTFPTKGKICIVSILGEENIPPSTELKYIPISNDLKKMAEKLGDYLHAQKFNKKSEDSWWHETREYMEKVYEELTYIGSGALMGAPLMNPKNNSLHFEIELPLEEENKLKILTNSFSEKEKIKLRIKYLKREEAT